MSDDVKSIFNEAREIVNASPKGAAALLRLALQHLCKDLGEKGLNDTIQKALDIVRIIGNEAVHAGQIDLDDNKEIALAMFELINLIAQDMISTPKQVDEMFKSLPKDKITAITKRDKKTTPSHPNK